MKYCKYEILHIDQFHFSQLDIRDNFFDSLRKDYEEVNDWFEKNKKVMKLFMFIKMLVIKFKDFCI